MYFYVFYVALVGFMRKELISRKELCAITGVSFNVLEQQFRNQVANVPHCVAKDGLNQLYERDAAIEWVLYWRSGQHKKRL